MELRALRRYIVKSPIFTTAMVAQWFPDEPENQILVQLSRFVKAKHLIQVRRGLYVHGEYELSDNYVLANFIYQPAYLSMESALNDLGFIPDVPFAVTCVTTNKTKEFDTEFGRFAYNSIRRDLFFGYEHTMADEKFNYGYNVGRPEKVILDYFYLRPGITGLGELRLRTEPEDFDTRRFLDYASHYNRRVQKLAGRYLEKMSSHE